MKATLNEERQRLEAQHEGKEDWRLWGPYLSERAWGTVREDYSAGGTAWEDFDHDQSRSRAYRWNEDGMGGISDEQQRLCFALALWNGKDPILKERAFGLTGNQGNHGEDVKEYYFYVDATPSHSWMRYLYKYPQAEYPYGWLVEENRRRSRQDAPFTLLDTGVFNDGRYFDIEVRYAKASPDEIHIRVITTNHGPEAAPIHLIPTLWFRNDWSWGDPVEKPQLKEIPAPKGAHWAVQADHPTLGTYYLYGRHVAQPMYTENESNAERLWNVPNATPYVKDAFHRRIVNGDQSAVNPARIGTKFGAWHALNVDAGHTVTIGMTLSRTPLAMPFDKREVIFAKREADATTFYEELLPEADPQDMKILRQSLAGMIWSKQFFHFDVARWLDGDQLAPPEGRKFGRNRRWRHMKAHDVISMPDTWEYPWFAQWDLAFHCAALALVDVDFAKDQIELLLNERYISPNGQVPAYEWSFDDVNPPVLAMAALKAFRAERVQRGRPDIGFLQRVTHKLLMNYCWWLNRKDADGNNVFEGGFLGLDNISVYDRSQPLPPGYSLKQADATGWVAMFALNMTMMCLELSASDSDYEDVAIQCYMQFLGIAKTIAGGSGMGVSLWDEADGFFKDVVVGPDGSAQRIDVFSWVGLIPLFACEIVDQRLLKAAPRFHRVMNAHRYGLFDGMYVSECPTKANTRGEHLLALVDGEKLKRVLQHLLSESEFLSDYGVRAVSRIHAERKDLGHVHGIGRALIEYVPGESTSGLFGGNSNWRGPIWMPTNYVLVQAIERYHRFLGEGFKVPVPFLDNRELNLNQIAKVLSDRLVNIFRRGSDGRIPALPPDSPFQREPAWRDLLLFNEYFHGETGLGLGAMHQTGWTGLVANLMQRRYRIDIPAFWKEQQTRSPEQSAAKRRKAAVAA
jgi:hypothetical protein